MRRGISISDTSCIHGCDGEEDETHVFFACPFAKALWFASPWGIRWKEHPLHDINDYLNQIWSHNFQGPMLRKEREKFILYSATIIDHIWWIRNEKYHKEIQISLEDSVRAVKERFNELNQAFKNLEITDGRT